MLQKLEDLAYIKRYLDAQLSPEEQADFERRLQTDPDFAETTAFHKQLYAALKNKEADRLKGLLRAAEAVRPPDALPRRDMRWIWPAVAAAAVLVCFCIWFLRPSHSAGTDQALFAQYFHPYENTYFVVSRDEAPKRPEAAAFQAYEAHDYAAAAARFAALRDDQKTPEILFFQANALLSNGQAAAAKMLLVPLAGGQREWPFAAASQWYLALTCLQLGQSKEAKQWLQRIAAEAGHFKKQEAGALLKEMGD